MTTSHLSQAVPLKYLNEMDQGRVVDLIGPHESMHRLRELGLQDGTMVCVVKRGEPSILSIDGKRLSLRLDPATTILIEVVPPELPA